MPIYEYRCESCGTDFERLTDASRSAPQCPECNAANVTRTLSAFGMTRADSVADDRGSAGGCGCNPATCSCRAH